MQKPLIFLVLLGLLLAPSMLRGQEVDGDARRLFTEGVTLLQDHRFADALARLEQARALREVPAIVYNMAVALRGLGRYVEAAESLRRFLALTQGRLDPQRQADAERLSSETQAAIAYVTVRVAVAGATVTIDERVLTPEQLDRAVPVNPGAHVFRAYGDGLTRHEVERRVGNGERTEVQLSPTRSLVMAALRVEPSVPGAEVWVDRQQAGVGQIDVNLAPGRHEIQVRAAGYRSFESSVMLVPGQRERFHVDLTRSGSLLTRWWFWTAVGVAAAGVTAGLVIGLSGREAPEVGTLGFTVQAQQGD